MQPISCNGVFLLIGHLAAALLGGCGPQTVAGRRIERFDPLALSWEQQWRMAQDADRPARREHGKLWMLDGVCGDVVSVQENCRLGLMAAGLPWAMEIWTWQYGWRGGWLCDVTDRGRLEAQADRLVEKIHEYQRHYPGRPVRLAGLSAGAGVVVFALERLEPDSVVDVLLLSPALSGEYDLTAALAAVRRRMIVVYSPLDRFVLDLGTRAFGTADRRHGPAAGATGFTWDAAAQSPHQRQQYEKLLQIRWRPWMIRLGYLGEHATSSAAPFAARVLAPLLAE